MKETEFIRQNKDKWAKDEAILQNKNAHPDDLTKAFSEITEDLSYARTFYSYRSVRIYLNRQAQYVYFKISRRKISWNLIRRFWSDELPKAMVDSRKDMNIAFYIFLFGVMLGVVSSVYDPEFSRLILGEDYVNITLQNIENGDPMAIYKSRAPFDMFLAISFNNLFVAYKVFVMGILFSVGSAIILFYNAIMIGTFQFFFFERAIFLDSVLAIWLHGTLEISSIILAAGAGLTLGRGLLFPGTLSRFQAFQISAQRGLKIMLGITPVFVLAAIIESFATRYTDAPNILRILIILASLTFVFGYYIWYPWKKEQEGFDSDLDKFQLPQKVDENTDIHQIKSISTIFSESFLFIRRMGGIQFLTLLLSALALSFFFVFTNRNNDLLPLVGNNWFVYDLNRYFMFYKMQSGFWLNYILFVVVISTTIFRFRKISKAIKPLTRFQLIAVPTVLFLWHLLFLIQGVSAWFILFFSTPFVFLIIAGIVENEQIPSLTRISSITFSKLIQSYFLSFLIVMVTIILFMIVYSPVLWFYMNIIQANLDVSSKLYTYIIVASLTGILAFVFFMMISLLFTSLSLIYYSNAEYKFANALRNKIKSIRIKKTAYGLERE